MPERGHPLAESPAAGPAAPRRSIGVAFDPGWLFLIAGLCLLAATVLLPAMDELNHARWLRDRARIIEEHRIQRLARHEEFLGALERRDEGLLISLAATQLNQIPTDRTPLGGNVGANAGDAASVFPALEPDPIALPEQQRVDTTLHRLATGRDTRMWMIGISVVLIVIGLLPQGRPKR